jgi:anti-anti-sigma factor
MSTRVDGPPNEFSTDLIWQDQAAVVRVSGELDMSTAGQLEEVLTRAIEPTPPMLVIDLTDVSFLASAGLAVLVHAQQRAAEPTQVRLVVDSANVRRPLEVTGLAQEFDIRASATDALERPN